MGMKRNFSNAAGAGHDGMPREFIEKYPLLGKALTMQQKLAPHTSRESTHSLQPRGVALIEDTIDRPHAEKEALMVSLIFLTGHFNYPGHAYLRNEFSPATADILTDIHNEGDGVLGRNYAAIMTVFKLWEMEQMIDRICTGEDSAALLEFMLKENKAEARQMREDVRDALFENLYAPKLETLYIKTERRLLQMAGIKNPGPPRNGGRPGL